MHIPWHKVLQITKEHLFLSELSSFENTKPDKIVFEGKKTFLAKSEKNFRIQYWGFTCEQRNELCRKTCK